MVNRQNLNIDWQSLWLANAGFIPDDNHTLIFHANYPGHSSDFTYQLSWGDFKLLVGGGAISVGSGLTGIGTIANPARIVPGTALNDVLLWNGVTWVPSVIPGVVTSSPLQGNGTIATPITVINGTTTGDILQWNGAAWVIVPEIRYQVFTPTDNQVLFILATAPILPLTVGFYINGIKQIYGTDFNIVGTSLNYTNASYNVNTIDILEVYY